MDNDFWIKRKLAALARDAMISINYLPHGLVSTTAGNELIGNMVREETPFAVTRMGATEMRCVSRYLSGKDYLPTDRVRISKAAGVFPSDNDEVLDRFCQIYIDSVLQSDVVSVWGVKAEATILKKFKTYPKLIPLTSLEPYYFQKPWSANLRGKNVLIIHPFTETIKRQLNNQSKLWKNPEILPKFDSVQFIRAIQSNAGGVTKFQDWEDALNVMKRKIRQIDFDIAIIGAGAYGLPLAAFCKGIGKQAIQMSGATQLLFGIKGKRWDNHPIISGFYNDYWTRPSLSETPPETSEVEGGSYW